MDPLFSWWAFTEFRLIECTVWELTQNSVHNPRFLGAIAFNLGPSFILFSNQSMLTQTQPLLIFIPGLQNICLSFAKPASWFSTDYLFPCQISIHLFSFACPLASLALPVSHSPFGSITRFHLFAHLFSFIPTQLIHCHFSPLLPWTFPFLMASAFLFLFFSLSLFAEQEMQYANNDDRTTSCCIQDAWMTTETRPTLLFSLPLHLNSNDHEMKT